MAAKERNFEVVEGYTDISRRVEIRRIHDGKVVVEIVGVEYGVLVGIGVGQTSAKFEVGEGPVFDLSERADEGKDFSLSGPYKGAAVIGLDNG